MSDQHEERLADRLGLDERGQQVQEPSNLVRNMTADAALTGYEVVKSTSEPDAVPPSSSAFVRPGEQSHQDVVFRVDTYELASARDAHEHLVRMLTQFQSPHLAVSDDIGDLAVGHADTAIVARRANIVFVVRNADGDVAPVLEIARAVDGAIQERMGGQPTGGAARAPV
jgi:hypothetical protein